MSSHKEGLVNKTEKPRFFYGYNVVVAAFFIMVVTAGAMYTFGVFFTPLLTEFGWTRAMTSGAFSLSFVLQHLLAIGAGRLTDRFGPRLVMGACGLFLGLGYVLMSQISAIWQLYLFYGVVVALGASGSLVPVLSTVARWFVRRRGMMTGIVVSGVGLGTVIMPPLATWLISTYAWRTSYIIIGIIALVFIISAAQFLRRDPAQIGQVPYGEGEVGEQRLDLQAQGLSLRQAIYSRQFWMVCVMFFCLTFCVFTIMVHIVPHAIELGISPTTAASFIAAIGGLSIAGKIVMGSGSDRIGIKLSCIIAFIMVSIALLWLQLAEEVWMLYLFAAIFGFAYGGFVALISPLVAELFGLGSHGAIFGAIAFVGSIGGAVGPIVAGRIFDVNSSYALAFLVCALVSIISLISASILTPTSREGGGNDSGRSTRLY